MNATDIRGLLHFIRSEKFIIIGLVFQMKQKFPQIIKLFTDIISRISEHLN